MELKKAEDEAKKFAVRLEDRIKNGDNINADKLTVEKRSKLYLNDMKPPELARTTYYSYKKIIQYRIILYLGREKVARVNGHIIKNHSTALRAPGVRLDGKREHCQKELYEKALLYLAQYCPMAFQKASLLSIP